MSKFDCAHFIDLSSVIRHQIPIRICHFITVKHNAWYDKTSRHPFPKYIIRQTVIATDIIMAWLAFLFCFFEKIFWYTDGLHL